MTIRSQITTNIVRSYVFMAGFIVLFIVFAYVLGQTLGYGNDFLLFAVIFSVSSSFVSYYFSDSIVLAMCSARPATRTKDFDLFTVTENLCLASHIPKPKLYVIEDDSINAFATGRDPKHAVVCATRGLLTRLDRREIEGVIAHELSHVKNYDTRLMAIVAVLAGTIAYAADFFMHRLWWGGGKKRTSSRGGGELILIVGIVLSIITPIIATLIQLSISRKREYLADASGALLTRYPEGLARALEKISNDKDVLESASNATAHLFISDPFKGKDRKAWFSNLFNTHPPITDRIKILRSM